MSQNLLSVRQSSEDNYVVFKDKASAITYRTSNELFTIGMRNKCFPLNWMKIGHKVYKYISTYAKLWCTFLLGHVNYSSLKQMASLNLVDGLPTVL